MGDMDNRTLLLQRALDLFAARGYDAVGVQEIVEAAGVTKPTLYHYFGSKEGVLRALLEVYQQPFYQTVQSTASGYAGDLPGTLTALARVFFDFAQRNPVYYRMLLAMGFAPRGSDAGQITMRVNEDLHAAIEEMFAVAVRDHGNMRGRQRLYAATFIGMLNTCAALWLNGYIVLDEALITRAIQQFQYGIYS